MVPRVFALYRETKFFSPVNIRAILSQLANAAYEAKLPKQKREDASSSRRKFV
jgi:hypothetical protein